MELCVKVEIRGTSKCRRLKPNKLIVMDYRAKERVKRFELLVSMDGN